MIKNTRRSFLRGAGGAALTTASLGGFAVPAFEAHAANVSGYRALVCLFFLGGLDCHDVLIPYDQSSYESYASIRAGLLAQYAQQQAGGSTRDRSRLLPLTPLNSGDFGGRQFALTEEFSGLHGLFEQGDAAIVANVGPLLAPIDRAEFEAGGADTPPRLFSHNDQQSVWVSSQPEGAQFGWGGRFADAALNSNANFIPDFTAITALGNELFLTGQNARPYQIGFDGAAEIGVLETYETFSQSSPDAAEAYQQILQHFSPDAAGRTSLIERDIARAITGSLELNNLYNQSRGALVPFSTQFPASLLGSQLRAIAETISLRTELQANRQVFFAAIGGFDTHSNQVNDLPALMRDIDQGVTAFFAAMQEIGAGDQATLFTASDFGRTLAINGDGTDHGWGGHHFVVGEAVNGRRIYGDPPVSEFGHAQDAGGGRLIPTLAVEQFAEPFGTWFGLTPSEIAAALPNRSSFAPTPLTFL